MPTGFRPVTRDHPRETIVMKSFSRIACAAGFMFVMGAAVLHAQSQPESPAFADVSKVFNRYCVSCHSGPRPPEGLRLDTYKDVMSGARGTPVIVPKDPAKSELVRRIKGTGKPRMPKNGPPWLQDSETSLIEKWIAIGAPETGQAPQ